MDKNFLNQGLATAEVQRRLEKFGSNQLAKQKSLSVFRLFVYQFTSPLIYILLAAGLVTIFLKDFTDTLVILLAVAVNAGLGFYQEYKAAKGLEALSAMLHPKALVIRGGWRQEVDIKTLVPGDLLILSMGVSVPADGILLKARDLSLNEAILTGESRPVAKKEIAEKILKSLDAKKLAVNGITEENWVYMGTDVQTGMAKMLVVNTGHKTKMGKIAISLLNQEEEKTPLQKKLAHFSKLLAILVGVISLILLLVGLAIGRPFVEMFTLAVAVAVSAIPEGLVVALTAILALGMQRILKRKALVRKLVAAETLGGVTVICADKTGTLTEGKMKVVASDFLNKKTGILAVILCNDLRDPLEMAMWNWGKQKIKTQDTDNLLKKYPRVASKPFSSKTKLILTLHKMPDKNKHLLFVSGAPEEILEKTNLSFKQKQVWLKKFSLQAKKGWRLVGFGYKEVGENKKTVSYQDTDSINWLGIVIFEDPIRDKAAKALKIAQKAGIKVKVITGDYLETAKAVLRRLGLFNRQLDNKKILLGKELEKFSSQQLKEKIKDVVLFARTNPEQKLKIVQALQESGEVVAMTGDGVNDAPALKKANVGIVVSSASDVSKGTADMVLLDDNFDTIVAAIEEGRGIFENLRKIILYLLSDSFAEVLLITGSIILGLPLPVLASQILWVNLIDDGLPSLALTLEPKDKYLMKLPPKNPKTHLMNLEIKVLIGLISFTAGVLPLLVFWYLYQNGGYDLVWLRSIVFTILSIDSLIYVFSCRNLKRPLWHDNFWRNPYLIASVLIGLGLQFMALYLPFFQKFLKTSSLGFWPWMLIISFAGLMILMIEGIKWFFIHKNAKLNTINAKQ